MDEWDAYFWPDSNVLKNKAGLTHAATLRSFEFNKITTPSRAIAFRDEHILDAVKRFPELQGAADALAAAKRKSDAEYDAGTARLFLAKVQAQLLERLSTGDIIQPRAPDSPAKDAQDDYTRGR